MQNYETKLKATSSDIERMLIWNDYIKKYCVQPTKVPHQVKEICKRAVSDLLQSNIDHTHSIYVDIIMRYCLLAKDPIKKIETFLNQNIGTSNANCYCCLSRLYESKHNIPMAQEVFKTAIQYNAQPEELLKQKIKEFEQRVKSLKIAPPNLKRKPQLIEEPIKKSKLEPNKIIIQNSEIVFFEIGKRYEPNTNWTNTITKDFSEPEQSIEENLANYYICYVEPKEESFYSKKSIIIQNESMELDKSITEVTVEKSLFDASVGHDQLFNKEKKHYFTESIGTISHKKDSLLSANEEEDYYKQLFN